MRAVILAAGRGSRLREITGDQPKCLARVGGLTLLERQIASLRRCGAGRIAVVAGHRASEVRQVCDHRVDLIVNARYESTNSLYSLWLARDLLRDGFVVLNCDVLFHDQLLWDLCRAGDEDALMMSPRRAQVYSDEEMKICVRDGCVALIAKTLAPEASDGENVGIAKFGRVGAGVLLQEMAAALADGGGRDWLPRAFAAFARRRPLHVVETRGFPWTEIDFPEDYRHACAHVLPRLGTHSVAGERRRQSRDLHHTGADSIARSLHV